MTPRRPLRPRRWTAPPGEVCRAGPVPDLKPPGVRSIETPPGWHGLRCGAPSGMDP